MVMINDRIIDKSYTAEVCPPMDTDYICKHAYTGAGWLPPLCNLQYRASGTGAGFFKIQLIVIIVSIRGFGVQKLGIRSGYSAMKRHRPRLLHDPYA